MSNLRSTTTSLALTILCAVAAACAAAPAAPAPAPVAEKVVTQVVEVSKEVEKIVEATGEARWAAIQQSREIKVGVSAGASPYAFYLPDLTLDGFDVALAGELARRLGLDLVIRDLPPDALAAALQSGQLDLAVGPLGVAANTPVPRAALGPYYIARDAVLARPGSAAVSSTADLANVRLGVVRASDFAAWAQERLDAGRVLAYASAAEAASALARGEIDALMLDYRPAVRLAQERGLEVVGEGLAPRQEVVTTPEGSELLRATVQDALAGALADGDVARLAARYFGLAPQDILPLPIAAATLTPRPPGYFSADQPRVTPGECANLSWHVENVNAVFFSEYGAQWEEHPATGQETRQVCPLQTTAYELHIVHYDGREEARSVTVVVSNTPEQPAVVSFQVQPAQVELGSCVELRWEAPEDADRVRIARDGETLWDDAFLTGVLADCPPAKGIYLYLLEAEHAGGSSRVERAVEVR